MNYLVSLDPAAPLPGAGVVNAAGDFGNARVDVLTATDNDVVPLVEAFTVEIQQKKLLTNF